MMNDELKESIIQHSSRLPMRFCFLFILVTSLLFCSCRQSATREIDLTARLLYSEAQPDTVVVPFGTPNSKDYLLSGWSSPEKERNRFFQWAVTRDPAFAFSGATGKIPLYLHLVLKSFFSNPADVYLNDEYVSHITVDDAISRSSLKLPPALLSESKKNVVKIQFGELRAPADAGDHRKLAAAAYLAVVTPSKYVGNRQPGEGMIVRDRVAVRNKLYPAIDFQTGGVLRFFEKLNSRSVLRFGYCYQPAEFSENDDFAEFRVSMRKDGEEQKQIFLRKTAEADLQFESLPLSRFVSGSRDSIYEISFEVRRNSIFNDARTSWLQPTLVTDVPEERRQPEAAAAVPLRASNRNANVVIVLLDAAGAKHFGRYGYGRSTTPIIDSLAQKSVRFKSAYTDAVYTLASTATLMTGWLPERHRILDLNDRLPSAAVTMAEIFSANGYQTATFVANGNASGTFGMTQGFKTVQEVFREKNYSGWGQEITDHFRRWLEKNHNTKFFAYLHYREPHDPYNPPEEWVKKYVDPNYSGNIGKSFAARIRIDTNASTLTPADRKQIGDLYDANLAYGDSQVGQVLEMLRRTGIYDNTIVIVTADHGEAMYEHGYQGHNTQVYSESMHIPLIVKLKASSVPRATINQRVRTVDVFPTLVDLLGFSGKTVQVDGRSFLPYFVSDYDDGREVITQTTRERQYSRLDGNYKYIADLVYNVEELYDINKDPEEKQNLLESHPVIARYYRSRLLGYILSNRELYGRGKSERAVIDEAARENLKALGYLD